MVWVALSYIKWAADIILLVHVNTFQIVHQVAAEKQQKRTICFHKKTHEEMLLCFCYFALLSVCKDFYTKVVIVIVHKLLL